SGSFMIKPSSLLVNQRCGPCPARRRTRVRRSVKVIRVIEGGSESQRTQAPCRRPREELDRSCQAHEPAGPPAPERAGVDVSAACRPIGRSYRPYSSPGRRAWSLTCPTEPKGL